MTFKQGLLFFTDIFGFLFPNLFFFYKTKELKDSEGKEETNPTSFTCENLSDREGFKDKCGYNKSKYYSVHSQGLFGLFPISSISQFCCFIQVSDNLTQSSNYL